MKRSVFISLFVLLLCGLPSFAQTIIVRGYITDADTGDPVMGVNINHYATTYEAKDKKSYLEQCFKNNTDVFLNMEGMESAPSQPDGYFEIQNAVPTGGAVFYVDAFSEVVYVDFKGRTNINVKIRRTQTLDESKIVVETGDVPVFEEPESNGESMNVGIDFPLTSIKKGLSKSTSRIVMQGYFMDKASKDTVFYSEPIVFDGADYHATQLRRMGYDKNNDPLLGLAERYSVLDEKTKSIGIHTSVDIPDQTKTYVYNYSVWMEDYNDVIYESLHNYYNSTDRMAQPMRFLEYTFDEYNLDPNNYKQEPRKENMETPGSLDLTFLVGKAELDPKDERSMYLLDSLKEVMSFSYKDGSTLKQFHVKGVASPEGTYESNLSLANKRMEYIAENTLSVVPKYFRDRTHITKTAEVASWERVAELLEKDSLAVEAREIRDIIERYPEGRSKAAAMDQQFRAIRALSYYTDLIKPRLESLRSVNFTIVVEVFRELTPEEILEKFNTNKDFHDGKIRASNYEYWNLFNLVKDEDELIALYRRAIKDNKNKPWELPANNLAVALLRRNQADTTVLAPFIDITKNINQPMYFNGQLTKVWNVEELVANQVLMMIAEKKYKRAGQIAMILPDEKYRNLKMITRCLVGYYKTDAQLCEDIAATSPRNAIVMHMAKQKNNQAYGEALALENKDPLDLYLVAQAHARCYANGSGYTTMTLEEDENRLGTVAEQISHELAQCFAADDSYIDIARSDWYIHEKVLELALAYHNKEKEDPFDVELAPEQSPEEAQQQFEDALQKIMDKFKYDREKAEALLNAEIENWGNDYALILEGLGIF